MARRKKALEHYSATELEEMPTIHSGHFHDLKVDDGKYRWWLSRMTVEDGETHAVYVEELQKGAWVDVHKYGGPSRAMNPRGAGSNPDRNPMTKKQFEEEFRESVLPLIIERYEQDGVPDRPARREAWNDTVDAYVKDGILSESAYDWSHPRWLETARRNPSAGKAKKNPTAAIKRRCMRG